MPMRAAGKPCLDLRRLVGGIIVHHEVDVRPLGHLGVDPPEEVEELGRPMALVAFSDHGAGGDIERGEQGCRAITDISVRTSLGPARRHGQYRLLAIQRLDLRLLVHAQYARSVWRRSAKHTSELQSLMRHSYAVFCLNK